MASCHSVILLWATLLCTLPHSAVGTLRVKTVTADSEQCGSTFKLGDGDSYRIVMPKDGKCPSTGFNCTINFSRAFLSDSLPYHARRGISDEICVDFSRIRLAGKKTSLTFSSDYLFTKVRLTSSRYPLARQYMETVKCYSHYSHNLTATFSSNCDRPSYSLRDYFTSWVYVYAQSSKNHAIYYLDGTCQHTKSLFTTNFNFTIHSIFWQDTAQEPNVQNCSLQLPVYYDPSVFEKIFVLCTSWTFLQTSCEVSAHFNLRRLDGSTYSSRKYSCSMGKTSAMNSCLPNKSFDKYFFGVERNQSIGDDRGFEDGLSVLQVEGFVKLERKKKVVEKYEIYDFSPDGPSEEERGFDVDALSLKILFPLAILVCLGSCACGVSHKRAKQRREQAAQNGEANGTAGSSTRPEQDEHREVRTPLTNPAYTSRHPVTGRGEGRGGAGSRMDAPPPAYADLDHTSSPSSSAPRGLQPSASAAAAAAAPPSAAASASPQGTSIEPPPPLSDGLPLAPPAYHELFPSRV